MVDTDILQPNYLVIIVGVDVVKASLDLADKIS